jgi:hypothetical protein
MWQAARLSSACWSSVKVALEIRPFGYQDASRAEIDSFILYITSQKRSAKLFRVPIHSNYMWGLVSTSLIVVVILVEQGVVRFTIDL